MQLKNTLLAVLITIGIVQPLTVKANEPTAPTELTKKQIALKALRITGFTLELGLTGTVLLSLQFAIKAYNMPYVYKQWTDTYKWTTRKKAYKDTKEISKHPIIKSGKNTALSLGFQVPFFAATIHAGCGLYTEVKPLAQAVIRKLKANKTIIN